MEYKRFKDKIVVRLDKGEEILEKIKEVSLKEKIELASLEGIGAIKEFSVLVYDTKEKKYLSRTFQGVFEIVSLLGTINTMNNEFYTHLHISCADDSFQVLGGHLKRAVVSATCEIVITLIEGHVDRKYDAEIGLNLFAF